MTTPTNPQRPIYEIAREIKKEWPKIYFGAKPYVDAMQSLTNIGENYYEDSAKTIILYFLANAQTFKGEDAKRIKAELKKLAGIK